MSEQNQISIGSYLDREVQNNELGISRLQSFLNNKQSELVELQKILIEQIHELEKTKQKNTKISQVLINSVFPLFESLKNFNKSIVAEFRNVNNHIIYQMAQIFNTKFLQQESELHKQNKIITQIKEELKDLRINENVNETRKSSELDLGLSHSKSKKTNILSQSSFLEYHLKRREKSKSREESPFFKPSKSMIRLNEFKRESQTKKLMRQVQKTLREDHNRNNIHNFGDNSQKKYVKQKIELMKNKGKNIAYTRIPNERKL